MSADTLADRVCTKMGKHANKSDEFQRVLIINILHLIYYQLVQRRTVLCLEYWIRDGHPLRKQSANWNCPPKLGQEWREYNRDNLFALQKAQKLSFNQDE